MTVKTIGSVLDEINEWENPKGGTVYYVTCFFTDESVGSVGRKDHDAALEVQGLLREAIETEMDFTLEDKGATKTGKQKFNIKGFGTPGGAATYAAPGVPGAASPAGQPGVGSPASYQQGRPGRSPEHDQFIQERMDRRTALMQAVAHDPETRFGIPALLSHAEEFYLWLRDTPPGDSGVPNTPETSGSVSSAYEQTSPPSTPAGTDPESTSPAVRDTSKGAAVPPPAGDDRGGQDFGEGSCPPHQLDLDVAPKAMRYPCRKCGFWVKPTMAPDEVAT